MPHPTPVAFTTEEGGQWIEWKSWTLDGPRTFHSMKFSDGSILDILNGWRKNLATQITCDEVFEWAAKTGTSLSIAHYPDFIFEPKWSLTVHQKILCQTFSGASINECWGQLQNFLASKDEPENAPHPSQILRDPS